MPHTPERTSLWKIRDFLIVWWAQVVSRTGSQISAFVVPILVLNATQSARAAGYIGALEQLPYVLLAIPAGAVVERSNKRTIMLYGNLIRAALFGILAAYLLTGGTNITVTAITVFAAGTVYTVFDQASSTVFPRILSAPDVARATGWVEGTTALTEVLGPALGGLLIGLGAGVTSGAGYAFGVDALTYAIAAGALLFLRTSLRPSAGPQPGTSLTSSIIQGLRYLKLNKEIRRLAIANFVNIIALATISLSFIVAMREQFGINATTTGLMISLSTIAGIAGSFCTAFINRRLAAYQTMLLAGLFWSLGEAVIAISTAPWVAVAGLALALWITPIYFATLYAYRMAIIPTELHARINSIYGLLAHAGLPIGLAASGTLLDTLGWRTCIGLTAILFLSVAVAVQLRRDR